MVCVWTLAAISASLAAASAFRSAVRWRLSFRFSACLLSSLLVGLAPCLVPISASPWRFAATLVSITFLVKLYDLFKHSSQVRNMSSRSYFLYLVNPFWLVLHKRPASTMVAQDRNGLFWKAPLALAMVGLCGWLFSFDYAEKPFAVEHTLKVFTVVLTVILLADCAARVWRLLGGVALDPMSSPAVASTPAEFWRRWNRPVQQFLHEYPFRAAGGARRPVRATMAAFAVSGLVHEYVFAIASGRIQPWQLLFFSLQGAAAVVTNRIPPRSGYRLLCIGGTISFNLLLAMLFFKSVNSVLPFYSPRR
jgi:hypothetical protein